MAVVIGAYDRTGEFRSCTKSCQQRVLSGRLVLKPSQKRGRRNYGGARTKEFLSSTKAVLNELQLTETKLRKLCLLFDTSGSTSSTDATSKLIDVIRSDIVDLNASVSQIRLLERDISHELPAHSQLLKHYNLMIKGLEYRLAILINTFQKSLELNKSKITTPTAEPVELLTEVPVLSSFAHSASIEGYPPSINLVPYTTTPTTISAPSVPHAPQMVTGPPPPPRSWNPNFHLVSSQVTSPADVPGEPFVPSFSQQQQQHQLQQQIALPDQELRQRDANMKRVESTIVQLGEIYQQFSTLIHEQSDFITRIDSHTECAESNITAAHYQLSLFLRTVSARRAFMIKVFVVIFLCFLLFAWLK